MAKMPESIKRAVWAKIREIVERHLELTENEPDFESDGTKLSDMEFKFIVVEMENGRIDLDDFEVMRTCRNTGRVTRYILASDGRLVDAANTPERHH